MCGPPRREYALVSSDRKRLSSVLPASLLRFVLTTTGVSEAERTLDVQLLKERNKYDQIPLSLFDRLLQVLALADRIADEWKKNTANTQSE